MSQELPDKIVYTLPFPMPTWNVLFKIALRDRLKCKKLIHNMTYIVIRLENDSATLTESQSRLLLTQLSEMRQRYLKTIRPTTSDLLLSPRKRAQKKRPF